MRVVEAILAIDNVKAGKMILCGLDIPLVGKTPRPIEKNKIKMIATQNPGNDAKSNTSYRVA